MTEELAECMGGLLRISQMLEKIATYGKNCSIDECCVLDQYSWDLFKMAEDLKNISQ